MLFVILARLLRWLWTTARHILFNWFLKPLANESTKYKGFVGLKNQGATCYLNTLLQTWFMTQEVKECITRCQSEDSLIQELKCLFEQLANRKEESLSTKTLTSHLNLNVHKQSDIVECFRSLLNKLSSKMDQEHNILKIYQVIMVNLMKCSKCKQSTDENSFFLEIPLSVCSADASVQFDLMEKSLEEFLKEETMKGDNKYYCDKCGAKTEAKSRYYFKHLPQILTFQLKRFELDYNFMQYRKITDSITFPLDLEFKRSQESKGTAMAHRNRRSHSLGSEFTVRSQSHELDEMQRPQKDGSYQVVCNEWCPKLTASKENNAPSNYCLKTLKRRQSSLLTPGVQKGNSVEYEERKTEAAKDQSEEISTEEEEKKYELFVIWHHIGTYGSGHYYAEIKSDTGDWYNFNDENVRKMGKNISVSSSTAYVFMYRLRDTNNKAAKVRSHNS
ncbi:ubiquitin carboxyl-terminal hydrolase 47-like isoform X2 [Pristis pectinata]|uniref:ubiquitin carboxyl-terminal hydrolase 47-like isoform X2 n=1 Tax=Pristis pectinata TaxID=685728 RepID=UPI00223D8E1A|nr:ubiquitin carboxyl-terminal hydrolase 47-like isoform X2 [Pristis pectinata]